MNQIQNYFPPDLELAPLSLYFPKYKTKIHCQFQKGHKSPKKAEPKKMDLRSDCSNCICLPIILETWQEVKSLTGLEKIFNNLRRRERKNIAFQPIFVCARVFTAFKMLFCFPHLVTFFLYFVAFMFV